MELLLSLLIALGIVGVLYALRGLDNEARGTPRMDAVPEQRVSLTMALRKLIIRVAAWNNISVMLNINVSGEVIYLKHEPLMGGCKVDQPVVFEKKPGGVSL